MRVLHLISSGGMYGAEAVILNLSAALNEGGEDTCFLGVFSHDPAAPPALHMAALEAGLPSTLIPCRGQVDFSVLRTVRQLSERLGVHVVHAHGYKADLYSFLAFRARSRPALVSTCHTWYDNDLVVRLYGVADRWVLGYFDQVTAVSKEVSDRLKKAGVAPDRVDLVRNGIDVGRSCEAGVHRLCATEGGVLRVGLVGRLAPEKGIDVFLRAVALLANRHPEAEFVVAGDGPERAALESLSRELRIEKSVTLLGPQANMEQFYRSLDLLVSASRQEGLPMALLEGMASGLPLVATAVGEVPQVVVHEETGLLVEPEAAEALAEAMNRLMQDAALRERFGRASQMRVQTEFSAQRMAAEYAEVYRRALSRHTAAGTSRLQRGA